MTKGTYIFPDKSRIDVLCDLKKSNDQSVYVQWTANGLKYTCWLPIKGFKRN